MSMFEEADQNRGNVTYFPFNFTVEYDLTSLRRHITSTLYLGGDTDYFVDSRWVTDLQIMREGDDVFTRIKYSLAEHWERKNSKPFPWENYGGRPAFNKDAETKDNFEKI